MRLPLLNESESCCFDSYFEMPYEIDDILATFGVSLRMDMMTLPKSKSVSDDDVDSLRSGLESSLSIVSMLSDSARAQFLIAPVLLSVAQWSDCQLRLQYYLEVNHRLQGRLDYLLKGLQKVVIVAAKNEDISSGSVQLAIQLIALSKVEPQQSVFYGAVTAGNRWKFIRFDSEKQQIVQDIMLYISPGNIEDIVNILLGVINARSAP